MTDIEDAALTLIQSRPEGVLQNELWKILEIDSRKCSRIVKKLVESEQINRAEARGEGVKTYLLTAKRRCIDPSLLIAGGELLPCIGCEEECNAEECPLLMDWMYQLAIEEYVED